MVNVAVTINSVSKRYGSVVALKDVSLSVNEGEMFGIIGPDGAGKTTLLRILATLIVPDEGTAVVNHHDVISDIKYIRSSLGYMPGQFSLYPDLTVKENLQFYASLFNTTIEQNYDVIAPIYERLKPFEHRMAGKLSGGMKQKLALSCALIHRPQTVLLDEPTTGVDAVSRREFWDILRNLKLQGITIIVSTPYMDEASLCDRIALINEGRIMCSGTVDTLTTLYPHRIYAVSAGEMYPLLKIVRTMPGVIECNPFGSSHHLVTDGDIDIVELTDNLCALGLHDVVIKKIKPTIEDLFINLMK